MASVAERKPVAAEIQATMMLHKWSGYRVGVEAIRYIDEQEKFSGNSVGSISEVDEFVDVPFFDVTRGGVLVDYGNKDAFTVIGIQEVGINGYFFRAGWFSVDGIKGIEHNLQKNVEMAVGGNPERLEKYRGGWEAKGFKILEPPAFPEGPLVSIVVVRRKIPADVVSRDFVPGFYYAYSSEES